MDGSEVRSRKALLAGPGPAKPSRSRDAADQPWRSVLRCGVLLAAAALLFFSGLDCPLQEPEEPRYAEIPRQMLETSQVLVPVLHGQPYCDKPPLLYWLVMISYRVFGVHDWAARLVSSGAGFLTVLVTYGWGRRVAGDRAGFAAALMLALAARFVYLSRLLTMNSLLCLWVVAALAAAHVAVRGPALRRGWWFLAALACGLGCLSKGPVALILVAAPVLAGRAADRGLVRPGCRAWLAFAAAAGGVAAPWYLLMAVRQPDFLSYFFWRHNVQRYLAPFDHAKPPWYYVSDIVLGMFPWSLLLLPLAQSAVGSRQSAVGRGEHLSLGALTRPRSPAAYCRLPSLGFPLSAALVCFLFYSLAGSKRAGYILPAMPPLALALGSYLAAVLARLAGQPAAARPVRRWTLFAVGVALLVLAFGVGGSVLAARAGFVKPAAAMLLAVAAAAAFGLLAWRARHGPATPAWAGCGLTTFTVLALGLNLVLPAYAQHFSLRAPVRALAASAAGPKTPVVCYPRGWDSVTFYLGRSDIQVYTAKQHQQLLADLARSPRTLAFVKTGPALGALLRDLPGSVVFVPQQRQGGVTAGWVWRR